MATNETVTIVGAGLAGTLMAVFLARRGYTVNLYDRRPDIRSLDMDSGRSINLALSHRGRRALEAAGVKDSVADVEQIGVPMHGRMIHHVDGSTAFQPYGMEGEWLYSVSRSGLNQGLMDYVESLPNVHLHFGERCLNVDFASATTTFETMDLGGNAPAERIRAAGTVWDAPAERIIGADGAFSGVRFKMQRLDRFDYEQSYLDHGYKELTIPAQQRASSNGKWAIEPNALHIWPRGRFMLIALPNTDGSFTCTLFLPFEQVKTGEASFAELGSPSAVQAFFARYFPDALPLMPDLTSEFFANPTSSLVTIRCAPWIVGDTTALIGDAAHAIVPFYGQGINAGFEDCRIFDECLDESGDNWAQALPNYYRLRKPNGDAIAELARLNFIEMSERVADPKFLIRKKIEKRLHELHPSEFLPVYSMVTFSHTPYVDALAEQQRQNAMFEEIMSLPDVEQYWNTPALEAEIQRVYEQWRR